MRISKKKKDLFEIYIESPEDFLILDSLINFGDIVGKESSRIIKLERTQKKVRTYVEIQVEKKKIEGKKYKLLGKITKADKDIPLGYHSFILAPGDRLNLRKEIDEYTLEELRKYSRITEPIYLLSLELGKASLFEITNVSYKEIWEKYIGIPGKMDPEQRKKAIEEYIRFVNKVVERILSEGKELIVCGPKSILEKIEFKVRKMETPNYGLQAVRELLRREDIPSIIKERNIAKAYEIYQEYLKRLGKEDLRIASGAGIKEISPNRIEALVLTNEQLLELFPIAKEVIKSKGKTIIIDANTEIGKIVENLGGLALLRW